MHLGKIALSQSPDDLHHLREDPLLKNALIMKVWAHKLYFTSARTEGAQGVIIRMA